MFLDHLALDNMGLNATGQSIEIKSAIGWLLG